MTRKKQNGHPYYPRYPTIYQSTTYGLTLEEHGALTLLFDHYMLCRGPLPGDSDPSMAGILGCTLKKWSNLKTKLVTFFKPNENTGFWYNSLCEELLNESDKRIENARTNGNKGGRPSKLAPNENQVGLTSKEQKGSKDQNGSEGSSASLTHEETPSPKTTTGLTLMEFLNNEESINQDFYKIALGYSSDMECINWHWEYFRDYWIGEGDKKSGWHALWRRYLNKTTDKEGGLF